jgi:hypothetical protein
MSIFPKRTLQGTSVTIHWNFNTSALKGTHWFPLVRIGVKDPEGKITMLFERHVLALPSLADEAEAVKEKKLLYLNKNFPLLFVAGCLSGKNSREKLVDILENIQGGRHYYFTFAVPDNAAPGKYTLISEVISDGEIRHSKTASDDFFFVEKVAVQNPIHYNGQGKAALVNYSPEPVPVKLIEYYPGRDLLAKDVEAFELKGNEEREITFNSVNTFLSYNEEREVIPVLQAETVPLRNPYFFALEKETENSTYIMHRDTDEAYVLEGKTRAIWHQADGLNSKKSLRITGFENQYDEMLGNNLIQEVWFNEATIREGLQRKAHSLNFSLGRGHGAKSPTPIFLRGHAQVKLYQIAIA